MSGAPREAYCDLSAVQARTAIEDGSLTAEALARSCLERVAEREADVQAWATIDEDRVLAEARKADGAAARGRLHGLPLGMKDIIATADYPTACGSSIYEGAVPPWDAAVVSLARSAGGVVMGKTVTTEFAYFDPGKTRNPLDLGRTPGGSSSGSAAAVAAGMTPLALGTQTAGSVIRPAAYCGIVGYKPSLGLIETAGVKPLARSFDTVGVFSRTVEDAALFVEAVSGKALFDAAREGARPSAVGLCRSPAWDSASPAMRTAFEGLRRTLEGLGTTVRDVELPPPYADLLRTQARILAYEAARALAFERREHGPRLSAHLSALLDEGWRIPRETYETDLLFAERCRRELREHVRATDVLITPSAAGVPPPREDGTGDPVFCRIWTLLGAPCVNLPILWDGHLPLGVQVVGAFGEDARTLSHAAWLHNGVR